LGVLLAASVALAQGTYTQIDYPGAIVTEGIAIDTSGDIAGAYFDASGNEYGFLLSGGTYSTIAYPGSTSTFLAGINGVGQIVGDTSNPNIGFLYDVQTQTFTALSDPRATQTQAYCINDHGVIGGAAFISQKLTFYGFGLVGSTYHMVSPPGADISEVLGVTDSDKFLVVANTAKGANLPFLHYKGTYSQIPIPSEPNLQVFGVSPQGAAFVGFYNPSSGVTAAFIYQNKILTTLQFPGSNFTQAYGINKAGEVVGTFVDAENNGHGFTWTP
jgi:probable HAF family extracellular repeat protein